MSSFAQLFGGEQGGPDPSGPDPSGPDPSGPETGQEEELNHGLNESPEEQEDDEEYEPRSRSPILTPAREEEDGDTVVMNQDDPEEEEEEEQPVSSLSRSNATYFGKGKGVGKAGFRRDVNSPSSRVHPEGARRHRHHRVPNPFRGMKSAIRRLARRGGVKRMSGTVYAEAFTHLQSFVRKVVYDAMIYMDSARRKTVTAMDVVMALKRMGKSLYGFGMGELDIQARKKKIRRHTEAEQCDSDGGSINDSEDLPDGEEEEEEEV